MESIHNNKEYEEEYKEQFRNMIIISKSVYYE